jgi:hypothetical protein
MVAAELGLTTNEHERRPGHPAGSDLKMCLQPRVYRKLGFGVLRGEEIDEIPDRYLSMPGSHGRYLKGFVSGDSRGRKVPGVQNIPTAIDRKRL